jgi:Tfp pilus assembly protein PilO
MKITLVQQYIILGIFAFLGLGFLYYEFLLKPVNSKIVDLQQTLDSKKKDLEEAKKTVAQYAEFKKKADAVQRELEWDQSRIPDSIDKAQFLQTIGLIQSRSGVFLTNFQIQNNGVGVKKGTNGASYSTFPTVIQFQSNYQGLIDFLYQLSISPLFLIPDRLVVTPYVDPQKLDLTLTAQLSVEGVEEK